MAGVLDFLIGQRGLDRQLKHAEQFAEAMYDPSILNPQLEQQRAQASEGIADDPIRDNVLESIFRQMSPDVTGTGQGSALAFLGQQAQAGRQALAQAEGEISLQDEQAKLEGRAGVAEVSGRMREVDAQRQAALSEARMMVEAEARSRKQAVLGSMFGLASAAIPGIGSVTGILSSLFGNSGGVANLPSQQNPQPAASVPTPEIARSSAIQPRESDILQSSGSQMAALRNIGNFQFNQSISNLFN